MGQAEDGASGRVTFQNDTFLILDHDPLGHGFDDAAQPNFGFAAGGLGVLQGGEVLKDPDGRVGRAFAAPIDRSRPGNQRHALAVRPMHHDVIGHAAYAVLERLRDRQLLGRIRRSIRAMKPINFR